MAEDRGWECPSCYSPRCVRYGPARANLICSECGFRWRADDLQDMHTYWLLGQEDPLTEAGLEAELMQERHDRGKS